MFVEYIYIYIYIWTVQPRNGTPKHSETETFRSNWKNETPTETELTTLEQMDHVACAACICIDQSPSERPQMSQV
jgi:hypothetical protein